jgi:hypothetical protein
MIKNEINMPEPKRIFFFNQLIITYFLGILGLTLLGCNTNSSNTIPQESNATVKFLIEGGDEIENIIFTKFGGFTDEDITPFKKNIEITLNEPINNFYQLLLQKDDKNIVAQMWLKGKDVVIKGKIINDEFQIDTIINSPFYYYTIDALNRYSKSNINTQKEINNSLLTEITNNIDNPFSSELASIYMEMNLNNLDNLKLLQGKLANQNTQLKNHIISIHQDLEKLIAIESIQLDSFNFNDEKGRNSKLPLSKGRIYMLDFWFTDCRPCIVDHQTIDSMFTFFKDSNVEIVGISTESNQSKWMKFVSNKKYKWKNYIQLRENETKNTLSEHLGISISPTYLIINSNGEILNRNISLKKSVSFIKDLNQ